MDKNIKIGILLMVFGVLWFLNQLNIFPSQIFLVFLSVSFLAVYIFIGGRKSYGNMGFLIPGLILLAIAAYAIGSEDPSLFFLFLSLAFWAVLFIHTLWYTEEDWGTRFWPIFPGAGLMFFAGMIYATTVLDWDLRFLNLGNYIIAAVLIGVGIRLILKRTSGGNG